MDHAAHPNFSVRRASLQAYLSMAGPDSKDALAQVLTAEDRDLLEIQFVDPRLVPPLADP